jgi:dTMP kinase
MAKGRFVVFEGLDGAGTTTQLGLLREWLTDRGVSVDVTKEPSPGPIGSVLRQAVDGDIVIDPVSLALAFAADRADHLRHPATGISAALEAGRWVLSDRYVISSLAYQSGQGVELEWLRTINAFAVPADLTIFIDTPPEECLRRIERRGVAGMFHDAGHLQRTLAGYRSALTAGSAFTGQLLEVDGLGPPEIVFQGIAAGVERWLGGVEA